jgi:DNA-directed RNA polymerase subunit N (RpoN/RPB10)
VEEPNKDPRTIVERFYGGLKNYKTKESLEDFALRRYNCRRILTTWQQRYTRI